jgi:site-specific recombinase XerD
MTIKDYLPGYQEYSRIIRGRKDTGIRIYSKAVQDLHTWLERHGKSADPRKVDSQVLDEFMRALFYELGNIQNSTRAAKLAGLRSFFAYLVYKGVVPDNPARRIPWPKVKKGHAIPFKDEELEYILAQPDPEKITGLRDLAFILTSLAAGLRVSEICKLKIEDIEDTGSRIQLSIKESKYSKSRSVNMIAGPTTWIRKWIALRISQAALPSDPVFVSSRGPRTGTQLTAPAANNILKKYATRIRAKGTKVFIHKLRSTWATTLVDQGVPIHEVSILMGHSSVDTTMQYLQVSEKKLEKGVISRASWNRILKK